MMLYSFNDIGDLGDHDGWDSLTDLAAYNILQLNVTNLPFDIRLGMCLPKECTQEILTKASHEITKTLFTAVDALSNFLHIDLLQKYSVGVEVQITQPQAWYQTQKDQKSVAASIIGWFIIALVFLWITSTIINQFKSDNNKNAFFWKNEGGKMNEIYTIDRITRERDSTKPSTFRFAPSERSPLITLPSSNDEYQKSEENKNNEIENSLFAKSSEVSLLKNQSFIFNFIDWFSLQRNIYRLIHSKRHSGEDEELECLEGIRVMTMGWGILTGTGLYAMITSCRNLYVMLEIFTSFLFTLIASGNLAPDWFIFIIYFLGFTKFWKFYDQNNKISFKDYLKIYLHRYLKIAPIYYIIFFTGWFILPLLSSKVNWHITERLFWNWEAQWFSVMTFFNTLVPFFTRALEGCYYWPYVISNDLLLYTLFPLWIIIYKSNKNVFYIVNLILLFGGMITIGIVSYINNLKVGIISFEDYYLFSYEFNKPYTKTISMSLGMFMALFYMRLIKYRSATEIRQKTEYSWIHFMKNSRLVTLGMYIYAITVLNFVTGVPFTANKDAYSWTRIQNTLYYSLGRFGYKEIRNYLIFTKLKKKLLLKRLIVSNKLDVNFNISFSW